MYVFIAFLPKTYCIIQAHKHYDWDDEKKEWVPKTNKTEEVNEDFIAEYQANYGVQYDDIYSEFIENLKVLIFWLPKKKT